MVAVRFRWRSFKAIVRLWVELFDHHNLLTYASAIALQALIAEVSFLLLGLGILGASHDTGLWNRTIGPTVSHRVLHDVYRGLNEVVQRVFHTSSAGLIAFAAVLAVWEVSGVVRAVIGALDMVYDTTDERPWWIRFPLSFAISALLIVTLIGAIVLVMGVRAPGSWDWPVAVLRWIAAIGLLLVGFGVLVRFAPAERRATRWVSSGALLVVGAWIVETLVFRWYVTSVADFRSAIGSFAVFILASSYLYVGAIILLVAMELDEVVRRDLQRPPSRRRLLPLVAGMLRGPS